NGNNRVPIGIPIALPTTKVHRRSTCHPRRTLSTEMICPVQPPKTAITAANWGLTPQTQIDTATIAKANPEIPCTNPAIAAPIPKNQVSIVIYSEKRELYQFPVSHPGIMSKFLEACGQSCRFVNC